MCQEADVGFCSRCQGLSGLAAPHAKPARLTHSGHRQLKIAAVQRDS